MLRLTISEAAFAAIASTLPEGVEAIPERTETDKVFVWLPKITAETIDRLRGPGEDHSDVILRLAALEGAL